jgi:hypothetical protein
MRGKQASHERSRMHITAVQSGTLAAIGYDSARRFCNWSFAIARFIVMGEFPARYMMRCGQRPPKAGTLT